jgi:uncharacterized membrane protein (DUF4010 family)
LDTRDVLIRLGISLGLGLLVGLQRERKGDELAGIRTFSLLTLFGTLLAFVGMQLDTPWAVPTGALALGILMAVGFYIKTRNNQNQLGLTTEIAALLMYGLGAYLAKGDLIVGLVLGGAVVLLLYWKEVLHGFVRRLGDKDVSAIMQFVLLALVILPVLPFQKMGPYDFFNPRETWLVVVLVVGISLGGYVLYRTLPPSVSAIVGGGVGGLISSTATTVSYSRRAGADPESAPLAAQAIMMANTVSVVRILALLVIVGGEPCFPLLQPVSVMAGLLAVLTLMTFWLGRHAHATLPPQTNPTELKAALFFAALYTVVKLATAWGKATFGAAALYVVGAISGLTDVDAITLSMSQSMRSDTVAANVIWRVIVIAILANLVFKGGCVLVLGSSRLKQWITGLFLIAICAGIVLIIVWPW